jgi:hypothetical protein
MHGNEPAAVPAATGGDVPARVQALLAPPPPRHPLALAVLLALLLAGVVTTTAVQRYGQHLFEQAKVSQQKLPE